jgi:BirA family biotin operon repressor/biotin-[acetyl-CoA-carboxylase] ligase
MSEPRAAAVWDGLTADDISRRTGVPRVQLFEEVSSTQDVALAWDDEEVRTLVLADRQLRGRGRLGRSWSSELGQGVWSTFSIPPDNDVQGLDVLTIRIGLGLARELDDIAKEQVGLKWPNDLLVRRGKLAGILVETKIWGGTMSWLAVGVGVNVLTPEDVAGAAGLPPGTARIDVLEAVARSVHSASTTNGHLTAAELKEFESRDRLFGRQLAEPWPGIARGIEDNGCLIIETPDGMEYRRSGTVQLAEDA